MDLVVVYNAQAGDRAWNASRVARLLADAGHRSKVVDPREDWSAAFATEPDAFVAAGGDGTVHHVIRAVAKRRSTIPVAVLPIGTANNVAHSLGYGVEDDLVTRAARWAEGHRPVRVGRVQTGVDERLLVETCGVGAFARELGREDSNGDKPAPPLSLVAMRESLIRRLLDASPMRVALEIDDARCTRDLIAVECVNLGYIGPRLRFAPQQEPDDSAITVCAIAADDREVAAHWVGTGEGDVARFRLGRGRAITLTGNGPAHVDGRRWPRPGRLDGPLRVSGGVHTVHVTV